jgi:hypothetical protein
MAAAMEEDVSAVFWADVADGTLEGRPAKVHIQPAVGLSIWIQ